MFERLRKLDRKYVLENRPIGYWLPKPGLLGLAPTRYEIEVIASAPLFGLEKLVKSSQRLVSKVRSFRSGNQDSEQPREGSR